MQTHVPKQHSPENTPDAYWVQRFKAGDRETAFNVLVRRYQERVYWTVRRIVGTHEDADDVAQETFVTVWQKLDQFREDANFFTWVYRISVNAALGHIRRAKTDRFIEISDHPEPFVDREQDADKYALAQERRTAIERAIQGLPTQQRLVFCMRYYDGLKYEDMALMLDKSTGTLKANYHHAIKKLEVALRDEFATT